MTEHFAFIRTLAIAEQQFRDFEVIQHDSRGLANSLATVANFERDHQEIPVYELFLAERALVLANKVDEMMNHIKPFLIEMAAVEKQISGIAH